MEAAEQLQRERRQHLIGAFDLRAEDLHPRARLLAEVDPTVRFDVHFREHTQYSRAI